MTNEGHKTHHLESYLNFASRAEVYQPLVDFLNREAKNHEAIRVLEVGCAAGAFLRYLASSPVSVDLAIGLDPDRKSLEQAPAGSIICGSSLALPFADDSFDFVLMVSVLHHLAGHNFYESRENWTRAFREGLRVCRPGGFLLVREGLAVKNKVLQRAIFYITSFLSRKHIGIRPLHIEADELLAFLTPSDIRQLCQAVGGINILRDTKDPRDSDEFRGILSPIWRLQTCRLTAMVQKCTRA